MSTVNELQQQLNQAEAKVSELREKLVQQKNDERAHAIASVKELIKLHQLTAVDLGFAGKKVTRKERRSDNRSTVAPKYQDPSTGKTWTGRGKIPVWLSAYLAAGHIRQDYLIK